MLYNFFCPKCGEKADVCVSSRVRCWTRIDVPYFVCVRCRLVYYDKSLTREIVSRWRKGDPCAKRMLFRIAYRETKKFLEKIIQYRIKEMGEKYTRFIKKPCAE